MFDWTERSVGSRDMALPAERANLYSSGPGIDSARH